VRVEGIERLATGATLGDQVKIGLLGDEFDEARSHELVIVGDYQIECGHELLLAAMGKQCPLSCPPRMSEGAYTSEMSKQRGHRPSGDRIGPSRAT
jgi:hypothetical protein